MKKIISLLCSLAVLLTLFAGLSLPFTASAATYGDLKYTISNGEVTITDYTGSATNLVIPSTIEGYPVVRIGGWAFAYCESLISITIPKSVTHIEYDAFHGCNSLTYVYFTGSADDWAQIYFNAGTYTAEASGLFDCNPMHYASFLYLDGELATDIVLSDGVEAISSYAFLHCNTLTSVTIPDSVTSIGAYAFYECENLTTVTLSRGVNRFTGSQFYGCKNFTNLYFNGTADDWVKITYSLGWLTEGDDVCLVNPMYYASNIYFNGELVTDVVLSDGVDAIPALAFAGCDTLTSISIPESVTSIGWGVCYSCDNFKNVFYAGGKAAWRNICTSELTGSELADEFVYIHYATTQNHFILSEVAAQTCTHDGCEVYICDCEYIDERILPATGHTFDNNVCVNCDENVEDCLASDHKYDSFTYQSWWVRQPGANSISLTFSSDTYMEVECDYLYIYDENGELFGAYTGAELAGKLIKIPSHAVEVRLVSDESINYFGFAVTDVQVEYAAVTPPATGDIDGDGAVDAQDAATVFYFINAIGALTDEQLLAADLNADGVVNLFDAGRLFYMVNGLIG